MYERSPTETNQKKDEKEQIMKKIRQLENQGISFSAIPSARSSGIAEKYGE